MAKHEFGIMEIEPIATQQFNDYDSNKYNCISIDDDLIEPILFDLQNVGCYWHNILNQGKGLAYCGITLIPPKSIDKFIKVLVSQDNFEYNSLIDMANRAKEYNKYIIHFGI